ncbi:hypothetical protein TNCV_101981 [Trichonephila clavipes]|nr:hypothetical protein TNCV_101981 [Trichonephila clavipes]
MLHSKAIRGLLAAKLVILNQGQMKRRTSELALSSPNDHTSTTGGHCVSTDLTCIGPPLHEGSSEAPELEPATLWPQVPDHNR